MKTLKEQAAGIRCLALDVDGTLTDGKLYFGQEGEMLKAFSVQDGQGLALLRKAGIKVAIITARRSEIVRLRAAELKIDLVMQGALNKAQALRDLALSQGCALEEIAMMGDDWPDLRAFSLAGLSAAPVSAHREVRLRAGWVSQSPAGEGAVRELCDFLLQAQGKYQGLLDAFLTSGEGG